MEIAKGGAAPADSAAGQQAARVAKAHRYIPGFDGMRAISVLMVLVAHVGYDHIVPGGLGVTVFFAISGFLITTLLMDELAATGTVNLKLFYARRAIRLYPELLALIALCLIVGAALDLRATVAEKLAGLLYYMNYYYVFGEHYHYLERYEWRQLWSLAVEEHFYFIFPGLMMIAGLSSRRRLTIVWLLIALPFLWRFVTYHVLHLPWEYNYVATDTRIDSIAWGCLLAIGMRTAGGAAHDPSSRWFIRPWLVPVAVAMLLATLLIRNEDFRWTWRFSLQGIAIVLLIANILFDPRWRSLVAALEFAPVRYIGRISYGLYLYHMLVNRIIQEIWPGIARPVLLVASLIACLAVASLSYQLLETPLKALRRRLGSQVR